MNRKLYLCEILDLVGSDGYVMLCSAKTIDWRDDYE